MLSLVSDLVPQIQLMIKRWLVIHSNIDCARPSAQIDETDFLCPHGVPNVIAVVVALGSGCYCTRGR